MANSKCLICGDETSPRAIGKVHGWTEYDHCGKTCIKLKEELSIILLLRKVLGISQGHLKSLLSKHGDPTNWGVSLCSPCNRVFVEAEFIHERLLKLHEDFDGLARNLRVHLRQSESTSLPTSSVKFTCEQRRKRKRGRRKRVSFNLAAGSSIDSLRASIDLSDSIRREFLKESRTSTKSLLTETVIRSRHHEFSLRNVKVEAIGDCVINEDRTRVNVSEDDDADIIGTENDDNEKEPVPCGSSKSQELECDDDSHQIGNDDFDDNHDDDYVPNADLPDTDNEDDNDFECDTEKKTKKDNSVESETGKTDITPFSGPQPIKLGMGHYKCPICGRKALSKSSSHGHILRAHFNASKPFHCHLCPTHFHRDVQLRQHLEDDHDSAPTPLDDPDEIVEEIQEGESLTTPSKTRKRTFKCDICPANMKNRVLYQTQETLEAHKKLVHLGIKRPYNCKLCDKSFKINAMLRHHMYVHRRHEKEKKLALQEQPFCHECNRSFKNMVTLMNHMRSRRHLKPQEYPYQCELCPKGFYQKNSLENHHAQEHFEQLNLQPFKCSFCRSVLSSKRALNHHIKIRHTKDTLFRCKSCDIGFMFSYTYNRHMSVVHAKEKLLLCSYCPKRFASKNHLETHTRTHTGEKPFKCPHCDKEYSDRPTYKRHLEIHGEQIYKCSICGDKEFKVWHSYRLHMKTHNQELYKKPIIIASVESDKHDIGHSVEMPEALNNSGISVEVPEGVATENLDDVKVNSANLIDTLNSFQGTNSLGDTDDLQHDVV